MLSCPQSNLTEEKFKAEQQRLLCQMSESLGPAMRWPDGFYGSGLPWLTFLGPSPGGGDGKQPEFPRSATANKPFWNEDYTEPCVDWSPGFKCSIRILIETILGRSCELGALKLYNFLNFDWIQNPNANKVPQERMRRGSDAVVNHLELSRPRTIVTLESRAHSLLKETLSETYQLRQADFEAVFILTCNTKLGSRAHRSMDAFEIIGEVGLGGSYVLRCPQHPARIFNQDYAHRVGRALRHTLLSLAEGQGPIRIDER